MCLEAFKSNHVTLSLKSKSSLKSTQNRPQKSQNSINDHGLLKLRVFILTIDCDFVVHILTKKAFLKKIKILQDLMPIMRFYAFFPKRL